MKILGVILLGLVLMGCAGEYAKSDYQQERPQEQLQAPGDTGGK